MDQEQQFTAGQLDNFPVNPQQHATPADLVKALHAAFGQHHARAVHAKGIILEGIFTPAPDAATITKAVHLQREPSKVIARFSDFTGIPNIPDNATEANPRGLSIKFITADGTTTDIVAHSYNGFPVANSDQFEQLLLAISASGPDATKPTVLDKFLEAHPAAKTFLQTQHIPESYASISYFGVNAFRFTNANGESKDIRYQFEPLEGEHLMSEDDVKKEGPEYLMDEVKAQIANGPIRFNLYAQIAEDGDDINNPSIAWPDSRPRVLLGVIELQKLSSNTPEEDKKLSFIPNNIPEGIAAADPMIDFRSRAYPISAKERQ